MILHGRLLRMVTHISRVLIRSLMNWTRSTSRGESVKNCVAATFHRRCLHKPCSVVARAHSAISSANRNRGRSSSQAARRLQRCSSGWWSLRNRGWLTSILQVHVQQQHPFNGPFPGQPRWAGTRKVKPIWILLKQEIVSGSGMRWAICNSAPRSRQITTPAPHHSVFYKPDALPAAQPTASKHWRHYRYMYYYYNISQH